MGNPSKPWPEGRDSPDSRQRGPDGAPWHGKLPKVHHEVLVFLLSLALLLGGARLLGEASRRLGFPAVVGEIIGGVLIGKTVLGRLAPGVFAWLFPDGQPKVLLSGYTTVAAMLLLVVAGLEIDLTVVRNSGRVVIATSLLGI